MKTLTVVAALLGAVLSQHASACDRQKEAEAKPIKPCEARKSHADWLLQGPRWPCLLR